jgi:hypothetical protein
MLVINSIEKARLHADDFSYSGSGVAWKARFVLFLGFALLAGGLAGSVVSTLVALYPILSFRSRGSLRASDILIEAYRLTIRCYFSYRPF